MKQNTIPVRTGSLVRAELFKNDRRRVVRYGLCYDVGPWSCAVFWSNGERGSLGVADFSDEMWQKARAATVVSK